MKLEMTLLVRDEADIVATNVEYHLSRGVDFIIATDNLSTDSTRGILERYRDRGVLHLILETGDNYGQSKWVTRMAPVARALHEVAIGLLQAWVSLMNRSQSQFNPARICYPWPHG